MRILREFGVGSARVRSEVLCRLDGPLHRAPSPVNGRIDYEVGEQAATLDGSWARSRATGDERARERLVMAYAPLVNYVAGRMSSGLPAHVVGSDLISSGLTGLLSAIERFDPSRRINFETYATVRIRGSIIDELRTVRVGSAPSARAGARYRAPTRSSSPYSDVRVGQCNFYHPTRERARSARIPRSDGPRRDLSTSAVAAGPWCSPGFDWIRARRRRWQDCRYGRRPTVRPGEFTVVRGAEALGALDPVV